MSSLQNLPNFLAYFATSVVLLAAFLTLYTLILPGDEWRMIREGNTAAALTLGGATIGFSLPLAMSIAHSDGLADVAVWAGVSLMLQLASFAAMHLLRRDVAAGIARGDIAEATLLASFSITLGLLNAACLT